VADVASSPLPSREREGPTAQAVGGRGPRDRARILRKHQTDAEKTLWHLLRAKRLAHCKWRRQFPIGRYIADFACPSMRLIVEADGGQHAGGTDAARDAWLAEQGWRILRFWNTDILANPDGVTATILASLHPLPPAADATGPSLSHQGRGISSEPNHA